MFIRYEPIMNLTCNGCDVNCDEFLRYQRNGDNYDLCKRCSEGLLAAARRSALNLPCTRKRLKC